MPPIFNEEIEAMNDQRIAMARLWDDVGVAEEREVGNAQLMLATILQSTNFKAQAGNKEPQEFVKWVFEEAGMSEDEIPKADDVNASTTFARSLMQLAAQEYQKVYLQASMQAQMVFVVAKKEAELEQQVNGLAKKEKSNEKIETKPLKLSDKKKPDSEK